ncbi:prolyl oligopeptidase family serine peptidase [Kitasatospora sp. NPDC049258]|uniref:alpha/beta hydrolase family protein n=1 Tax=Kitasatospora sp. NPDC049258 TaxID=3155394 RepID=UPI0034155AA0
MLTDGPARVSFRFTLAADAAVCLTTGRKGGLLPEYWSFGAPSPERRVLPLAESTSTQPLPTEDGRLLLLRSTGTGRQQILLADPPTGRVAESIVVEGRGLRLLPTPEPGTVALAVGAHGANRSTLYRVAERPLRLEPLAELPGQVGRTCWLDPDGRLLAAGLRSGGDVRTVVVDLAGGAHRQLFDSAGPAQALLLAAPRSGLLLVVARTPRGPRLGWTTVDRADSVCFPDRLNSVNGTVLPLALDPAGRRVALRAVNGARSRLLIHDLDTDTLATAPLEEGAIHPVAGWGRAGLLVPCSTREHPPEVAVLSPDATELTSRAGRRRARHCRVERFDGPGGEFDAVCQGDWRTGRAVAVALHGGPEAAWDLGFDPVLQQLAALGVAVVAPNQRGSTGYGAAHSAAIHGAWGGPDLADIRSLAATLTAGRPGAPGGLLAYGTSYGAYLALLAAAADPQLWSRCAVVAPFLSAARLYPQASPAVRALIDRLGGRTDLADATGPRDLWTLAPRIRARLLVVHGADDRIVPVDQARQLRRRLLDAGHCEKTDLTYLEVPGAGHSALDDPAGAEASRLLIDFLARPSHPEPTAGHPHTAPRPAVRRPIDRRRAHQGGGR